MRINIYGKDQLRKNWYLISLKRIFVARVCSITKFTYLLIFLVWNSISRKKLTFLYRKNMCWYNRTIQQHGAKTFHKVLYLVSIFFPIWLAEEKTKFKITVITFHLKLSTNEDVLMKLLRKTWKEEVVRTKRLC